MNRAQILEEIAAAYTVRKQQPWEFTRKEFAEATGLSYSTASRVLDELAGSGILRSGEANVRGRQARVYWRPEDEVVSIPGENGNSAEG